MRYVLVALVAVLGCSKAPPAATPANQAPAPDYQRTAADELAFLAGDADFVIGVDLVALRGSQMWRSFEPQVNAFMRQAEQMLGTDCGKDFLTDLERATVSIKMKGGNDAAGLLVMRGRNMPALLECSAKTAPRAGKTATLEGGVLVTKQAETGFAAASRAVGPSVLVTHMDKNASRESLDVVLAAGAPLRGSAEFLKLYERRERGASLWGMANGNAPVFSEMASSGMRPKSIDGTLVVTDRLALTVRMTMAGPAEATNLASEIDKVKAMATAYVERIEARVTGAIVQIEVTITEGQLRALIGMVGGMMGSP